MLAALPFPPLSPELFSISIGGFDFALRWYALAYIAGLLIGWWICATLVKRPALWPKDTAPLTPQQVEELLSAVILGVIIGGRLGYVLFYNLGYYATNPLDIFKLWDGGMAFHGGLLGVVVAVWWQCRKYGAPLLPTADLMALATPVGLFLGRSANFINAELWGRPSEAPWAVIFPGARAQDCGQALGALCARHPSQIYEALLEGLLLGLVLLLLLRRGALKTPGVLAGTFFGGYGIGRFIVEFFRQPDPQFISPGNPLGLSWHINGIGLTQGQTLTLPMIAIGAFLIWQARRNQTKAA